MKVSELPKVPFDAIVAALTHAISITSGGSATLGALKKQGHRLAIELITVCSVIRRTAPYLDDKPTAEILIRISDPGEEKNLNDLSNDFAHGLDAVLATKIYNHFINSDDIEEFDRANLDQDEKDEIRSLMAKARRLTDQSEVMQEWQRKKVLFHISKVENELHKDKSGFQAFIAAATEVSGLVRIVGKDAEPIAEAIQKARTITERKVEGTLKLESEAELKKLPKPALDHSAS